MVSKSSHLGRLSYRSTYWIMSGFCHSHSFPLSISRLLFFCVLVQGKSSRLPYTTHCVPACTTQPTSVYSNPTRSLHTLSSRSLHASSNGTLHVPTNGCLHAPSTRSLHAPSSGSLHAASNGFLHVPSNGCLHAPSDGSLLAPSCGPSLSGTWAECSHCMFFYQGQCWAMILLPL